MPTAACLPRQVDARCATEVVVMPAPISYRLDPELKKRLARRAVAEGVSETSLVSRLLDEGLKISGHPGIVYLLLASQRWEGLVSADGVDHAEKSLRAGQGRTATSS